MDFSVIFELIKITLIIGSILGIICLMEYIRYYKYDQIHKTDFRFAVFKALFYWKDKND